MAEERQHLESARNSFVRLNPYEMIEVINKYGKVRKSFSSHEVFEVEFLSKSGYKIIESIPAKEALESIVPDYPLKTRLIKIYEQILLRAESHQSNEENRILLTEEYEQPGSE